MKIAAPGKIIISGEHAVVYGKPAIALAVNRYVTTTITKENRPGILFDFSNLEHRSHLNEVVLKVLKNKIKNKYHRFTQGEYSIRKVLHKPFELAQFAFSTLTDALKLSLPHGIKIHIHSDIPMGCGMGSSAATVVSVMSAVSSYLDKPITEAELYKLALDAENMQHGASSGLDLQVALQGGCLFFQNKQIATRELPAWRLYLVNTGEPASTTGQCVEHAATYLKNSDLLEKFSEVTLTVDEALQTKSHAKFMDAIKKNHALLIEIGVVPEKIQKFIQLIESNNGAAKICGAGAISGDAAGMVLITAQDPASIQSICQQFDYVILELTAENRGVHVI
jgi:mevalonate kinase